jgi:hypothetical protein
MGGAKIIEVTRRALIRAGYEALAATLDGGRTPSSPPRK